MPDRRDDRVEYSRSFLASLTNSVILERTDGYSAHDLGLRAGGKPRVRAAAHIFYYSYAYVNRITSAVKYS